MTEPFRPPADASPPPPSGLRPGSATAGAVMGPGEGSRAPRGKRPAPAECSMAHPFPAFHRIARAACARVLRSLFALDIGGSEHLPPGGPYIVAANHHNYLDGIVLGVAVPHPVAFLVMPRVYHASSIHAALHRRIGSIRLDLDRPDPGAIRRALRVLDGGGVVGVFPEGPDSREGELVAGRPGVAAIALRSRVPVVPAAIHGTYEALRGRPFHIPRRHPLSVRFGPPIGPAPARSRAALRAEREQVTRHVMHAIESLLEAGRSEQAAEHWRR